MCIQQTHTPHTPHVQTQHIWTDTPHIHIKHGNTQHTYMGRSTTHPHLHSRQTDTHSQMINFAESGFNGLLINFRGPGMVIQESQQILCLHICLRVCVQSHTTSYKSRNRNTSACQSPSLWLLLRFELRASILVPMLFFVFGQTFIVWLMVWSAYAPCLFPAFTGFLFCSSGGGIRTTP